MWTREGIKLQVTTRENRRVCDWGICEGGMEQDGKKRWRGERKVVTRLRGIKLSSCWAFSCLLASP